MTYSELLSEGFESRQGAALDLIVIHDEEGDSLARSLAAYLQPRSREASYHMIVDKVGDTCRGLRDDLAPWAAGPIANRAGLHLCFTGRAAWTREQWLARPAQLDAGARVVAEWSRLYGIPLVKVGPRELNAPAPGARGVCGHGDVATAWAETSHTDPGSGFPFDVLIAKAAAVLAPLPAPTDTGGSFMALDPAEQRALLDSARGTQDALTVGIAADPAKDLYDGKPWGGSPRQIWSRTNQGVLVLERELAAARSDIKALAEQVAKLVAKAGA